MQKKCEAHFETRDRWTANRCWRKLVDCERGLIRLEYVNFDDPKKGKIYKTCDTVGTWLVLSAWSITLRTDARSVCEWSAAATTWIFGWGDQVGTECWECLNEALVNTTCSTTASVSSTIIATSVAKLPSICDSSSGSQSSIKASL